MGSAPPLRVPVWMVEDRRSGWRRTELRLVAADLWTALLGLLLWSLLLLEAGRRREVGEDGEANRRAGRARGNCSSFCPACGLLEVSDRGDATIWKEVKIGN